MRYKSWWLVGGGGFIALFCRWLACGYVLLWFNYSNEVSTCWFLLGNIIFYMVFLGHMVSISAGTDIQSSIFWVDLSVCIFLKVVFLMRKYGRIYDVNVVFVLSCLITHKIFSRCFLSDFWVISGLDVLQGVLTLFCYKYIRLLIKASKVAIYRSFYLIILWSRLREFSL